MKVLGVDPGTATTGFAIIEIVNGDFVVPDFGLIETGKDSSPERRLHEIHASLNILLERHSPSVMAIEKIFFASNVKTAIRVGQAQGVMLLSAAGMNVPVTEYAPGSIKKVVAGNGRADKKEVQAAVLRIFGSQIRNHTIGKTHLDNAVDAIAIALTHIYLSDITNIYKDIITNRLFGKR